MAIMPQEVIEALKSETTIKFLATMSSTGILNSSIVATISPMDQETIMFANLKLKKTKANLLQNKKFTVTTFSPEMESIQLQCTFQGFQNSGPVVDAFNEAVYNKIKLQLSEMGVGKVEEVYSMGLTKPKSKIA